MPVLPARGVGRALQCANFYNTIGTHMVPSQKPLMLEDALVFEQVCASVGAWGWWWGHLQR